MPQRFSRDVAHNGEAPIICQARTYRYVHVYSFSIISVFWTFGIDDDAYLHIPASPELGDIKLEIFQVRIGGRSLTGPLPVVPKTEKIHERSKKAVGHHIKFGISVEFSLDVVCS